MAEELRKVLMAGVGAVAKAVEKTAEVIGEVTKSENRERVKSTVEDLAKKGEDTFEKGKVAGGELFGKIGEAFSGLKDVEVDDIKARLSDLADDALDEVERAVAELKRRRAESMAPSCDDMCQDSGDTGMHPESGDKPEGYQAEAEKAADGETSRSDGEDLSEGTNKDE
jgi:polyhydroxyalkanoate synthesis regulator phasin